MKSQTIERADEIGVQTDLCEPSNRQEEGPVQAGRMMQGQNIVCFAKDWTGDPTSVTHVMTLLAEHNQVLWLNSIATRSPNLARSSDVKKIFTKLAGFLKGPQQVAANLWIYTPIVLPLPSNRIAVAINRWILRTSVRMLRRRLQMHSFQLWAWPPTAGEYVDVLGQDFTVFYCTDSWSNFSHVDGQKMKELEAHLCRRADVVFATSHALAAEKRPLNPETHLASHGVSFDLFATALDETLPVPADLADCTQPVLGFYGLIEDWMDQDLILYLAKRHPEWTIALIGKVCVDVSRFNACPNIRLLGRKPHTELPAYCRRFSVAMLPHKLNALTLRMNPIKLREYLSAGLPVVSTALPEVACYGEVCELANTYEEFELAVETALQTDSPELRRRRSDAMRTETWERKVGELCAIVQRVQAKREPDRSEAGLLA